MNKKLLIVLISLLGFVLIIFGANKLINNMDKGLKEENERLKKEFNSIQSERDSLKRSRELMKVKFDSIQLVIKYEEDKINDLNRALLISKKDLSYALSDLESEKSKIKETDKKIEELKSNPIKREGDQLLKSLDKKLKH